jgi:rubrerythrin
MKYNVNEEVFMANEQHKTLAALKTALQMEIDGKKYYQRMSRDSRDKLGAKLFQNLAAEEDIHRKVFGEIYKVIESKKAWPKIEFQPHHGEELRTLFSLAKQEVKPGINELEAVQKAMEMENKTHDFYQDQANRATFEAEKEFYNTLSGEESAHHAVLLDYYEYLKDPVGWFTVKEHHSLDGG